jgi:thiamine pyrophosphate-dependent acetolactate synthase large subunit-like protein
VLLDGKAPASFPTNHPLVQGGVGTRGGAEFNEVLKQADVVLTLERTDPAGTLRLALQPPGRGERDGRAELSWPRLINVSMEAYALSSWASDYHELAPAGLEITANVARTVTALLEAVRRAQTDAPSSARRAESRSQAHQARRAKLEQGWEANRQRVWDQSPVSMTRVAAELKAALGSRYEDTILAAVPLTWPNGIWDFLKPGAYVGADGGAGVGAAPGISVGVALAARGSGRPVVGLVGDGGLMMAPTSLWTAAHHGIPLLMIVANNRSYFNDEEHQDRVARLRGRPPENRWVGQRIDNPAVDFAGLARDFGVEGFGQISDPADLADTFKRALAVVDEGRPALVDVRITPR